MFKNVTVSIYGSVQCGSVYKGPAKSEEIVKFECGADGIRGEIVGIIKYSNGYLQIREVKVVGNKGKYQIIPSLYFTFVL